MKTQRTQSSDHGFDDVEFESRQEQEIFVSKTSRPLWGPHSLFFDGYWERFDWGKAVAVLHWALTSV